MLDGEARERAALGVVVVVDVHARVLEPPLSEPENQLAGRGRLLGLVVRPPRPEAPAVGLRRVGHERTEQEEQPRVGAPDRVPLQVEEDVSLVGQRQPCDELLGRPCGWPLDRLERGYLVASALELEGGLAPQVREPVVLQVRDRPRTGRQPGERRHAVRLAALDLRGTDAGDVHERIASAPLLLAGSAEHAVLALRALPRLGRRRIVERCEQPPSHAPPVGVDGGEHDALACARSELEVHTARPDALQGLERVGVEAQLHDVAGLGLGACELRVDRFVGERTEVGRHLDALEEVGDATHPVVHERRLEDDVMPLGQHRACPRRPALERLAVGARGDLDDIASLRAQRVEVGALVIDALVAEQLREAAERPQRHRLACGPVGAGQCGRVGAAEPR